MGIRRWETTCLLLVFSLGGCLSVNKEVDLVASVDKTARYIKAVYSLPVTLDPAQMNDTASLVASGLLYDGLLTFGPDLDIRGALAESWSTSPDGKMLTFKLRPNGRFHDGTPVTAQDAVASLRRLLAKESKVRSFYECIDDVHVSGEGELKVTLKQPFPPILSILAGGTAKILPAARRTLGPEYFRAPVGSGPFQWGRIEKTAGGQDLILRRFEQYAGAKPKVAEIVLRAVPEAQALKQARAGKLHDLANWPLAGTEEVFSVGQHIGIPVAATWIIGLNARKAPFNRLAVRKAFRAALADDADDGVQAFRQKFYPDATRAYGYIPPGLAGYRKAPESMNSGSPGPIPSAPTQQTITIAFPEGLAHGPEMARFLETAFKKHGWRVRVKIMPWDVLMKGYSAKTLQAFLVSMNMDYPDTEFLVRNFESTNPDNFSGLRSPAVDRLIRKARMIADRVERQKVYGELVEQLREEAATIDLFHPRSHFWVHRCVRGFEPNILADTYIDYRGVWIESNCQLKTQGAER